MCRFEVGRTDQEEVGVFDARASVASAISAAFGEASILTHRPLLA
jgi:hypothetical protein